MPTAPTLLAWLATYLLHATLLLTGALLAARLVRSPSVREVLWKGALAGGLLTATFHGRFAEGPFPGRLSLPLDGPGGAVIGLDAVARPGPGPIAGESAAPPSEVANPEAPAPVASLAEASGTATNEPFNWARLLIGTWIAGAGLGLLLLTASLRRARRRIGARRPVRDARVRAALARLGRPRTRVTASCTLDSPVALGGREVCLPARALTELDGPELEAMLAHELAHLERRDTLWFPAAHLLERLLWLQPLNVLVRRRLQADAELLCDDWAAHRLEQPDRLAHCLARVVDWMQERRAPAFTVGMAATPSALVTRVERLLRPAHTARRKPALLAAALLVAASTALALAGPGITVPEPPEPGQELTVGMLRRSEPSGADEARFFRVETRARAGRVLRAQSTEGPWLYQLDGEPCAAIEDLAGRLRASLNEHPGAAVTLGVAYGLDEEHLRTLVQAIYRAGAGRVLVEGDGERAAAVRATVLALEPVDVELRVRQAWAPPEQQRGFFPSGFPRTVLYRVEDRGASDLEGLRAELDRLWRQRPHADVRLDVLPGAVYEDVTAVLEAVEAAGFSHLDILTGPVGPGPVVQDGIAERKREIAEIRQTIEQRGFRPQHSRYAQLQERIRVLESEIASLQGEFTGTIVAVDPPLPPEEQRAQLEGEIERYLGWQERVRRETRPYPDNAQLDIGPDGRMVTNDGFILLDPAKVEPGSDAYEKVRAWLERTAEQMPRAHDEITGRELPDGTLRLNVHPDAAMLWVQRVMEFCGGQAVQIWRIELALAGTTAVHPVPLPKDPGVVGEPFPPKIELIMKVREPGTPVDPIDGRPLSKEELLSGQPVAREGRSIEYAIGPWKEDSFPHILERLERLRQEMPDVRSLTLDPRLGTRVRDVLPFLENAEGLGFDEITFVGAYPDPDGDF